MKHVEEIIKEIENRETINTDDYLIDIDDAWEDYIRGKRDIPKFIDKLTENIPAWKLVLIDKLTDFKVWLWLKTPQRSEQWE